jgi:hypothetical protein
VTSVLVDVVDAFAADRQADAVSLVFEYMAATQVETGRPRPAADIEPCDASPVPMVYLRRPISLADCAG